MEQRFAIAGSEISHESGGSWLPANVSQRITATIVVRRPKQSGDLAQQLLSGSFPKMSREEAAELISANPDDLAVVRQFAHDYGLEILAEDAEARTLRIEGTAAQLGKAFGVSIQYRIDPQARKYLSYQGGLTLPSQLNGVVEAVLGLDQRPVARHAAALQ